MISKLNFFVISFLFLFGLNGISQEYKGRIFIDTNCNGQMDRGEKATSGVAVSDGLNVVRTNAEGHFTLQGTPNTRFVFITVPSGFKTTKKHYLKIDEKVRSYDFGLCPFPASAKKATHFAQITDTETYSDNGWIQPLREYASNQELSFIVHTGDICYEKGLNFHGQNVITETMGVPVFYCIGNHDLVKGEYGEQLFETNFGPVYYSFDAGNTHYIVTPMLGGDHKPSYTKEDVYRWMKNDLQQTDPSKSVIVFNHDLLTFGNEFIYGISDSEQINLNEHNLKAWIYGHWHINYMKRHGNTGIVSVCASPPDKGGIDHSSSNFLVYEMNEKDSLSIHPAYNYLNNHFAVLCPNGEQTILSDKNDLLISVNFYNTQSPAQNIECKIAGENKWVQLKKQTDWNWTSEYPAQKLLKNTPLNMTFRALLKNGDIISTVKTIVIPENKAVVETNKNWTNMLGNPQHFNVASANKNEGNLQLAWTQNTGANIWICSPVFADGKVFIATMDEFSHTKNHILAYDAKTGKLLWKYQTRSSIKNSICIENDKVFATDEEGIAYAINTQTGQLVWEKELGFNSLGSCISGSVVDQGILYAGFGNYLSALDATDGKVIWKNTAWRGGEGASSTHTIAGNTLITASNWRALFGHDLKTGEKTWEQSQEGLRFRSGTAVFAHDTLFATAQKAIVKMNPANGTIYQVLPVPYDLQVATAPLITEKLLIFGTSTDGLVAFDRQTMKEIWKVKTGSSLIYTAPYSKPYSATVETAPVWLGSRIVFGASDGYLYVVDPEDGLVIQKIELGSPILASICISGNAVFVADFSGNISCFTVPN